LREGAEAGENGAGNDERTREGRADARLKLFRTAGHPDPMTSQPRTDSARRVAKLRRVGTSEQIESGNDAGDQHYRGDGRPELQPFFNDLARLRAVAVEQERFGIKPHAARDDRQQHEQDEIVPSKARGNGHDLIGDRSETFDENDPTAPLGVGSTECVDLVTVAIEVDQPESDGVVEYRADEVAEHSAGDRRQRAYGRIE